MLDRDLRYFLIEGEMLENLGYQKEKLLNRQVSEVLPTDVYSQTNENFQLALGGTVVTRDSSRAGYDIITRYIPLKNETEEVYAIMTVSIDITELKNAQRDIIQLNKNLEEQIRVRTAELKKSNEELEAFSDSVSHDLRAPLRGIIGFTSILMEEYGSQLDAEGKRIAQIITSSTQKMGHLIDDLLEFSRTGKQPLQKFPTNMHKTVSDIIEEIAPRSQSTVWSVGNLHEADVDSRLIRQVWYNLISNAIKYSSKKPRPKITIGSEKSDSKTVYYVRDNGVGFDPSYKHKLFKVFQRLHDSEEYEGTGVGLALVEKIVSRHGGKVWADAEENKGACFYFSLPTQSKTG